MLQEKAKEVEAPACGRAAARPLRVMYGQVKCRLCAVPHDTCPPPLLSSATPLFSELELTTGHFIFWKIKYLFGV